MKKFLLKKFLPEKSLLKKAPALAGACLSLALLFLAVAAGPALGQSLAQEPARVFDYAGLISADDEVKLQDQIMALQAHWPMDFVLLTIDDAAGQTSRAYADDFYDENGFGYGDKASGVLFLIDMDNREMAVSTAGEMIYYLTDTRIEAILDLAGDYLATGDYANAAYNSLNAAAHYLEAGIPGDQYTYDEETGEIQVRKSLTFLEIAVSLAVAAAIALIKRRATVGRYKLKGSAYVYNAYANSNFALLNQNDLFLRSSERRSRISGGGGGGGRSGGGRSTVHTGSSGRMHGGGSRKF